MGATGRPGFLLYASLRELFTPIRIGNRNVVESCRHFHSTHLVAPRFRCTHPRANPPFVVPASVASPLMRLSPDVVASLALGLCCVLLLVAHRRFAAPTRYGRVMQQGATFFLGLNLMQAGYWMLQPIVRRCAARGVAPSTISWLSLVPAVVAATAAARGEWALAAWSLLASALFDVLDGAVARASGTSSPAGAVLDSVLDRYAEVIVFAGLFVYYANDLAIQLVIVAAIAGSFLVSYSTAKAEALRLTPPRGSMKRSDRLTVMVLGAALAPFSQAWIEAPPGRMAWPVIAATSLIAVLANVSAIQRFVALARDARASDARESTPPSAVVTPAGLPRRREPSVAAK
jgi:phosphatidylglycerophosphate synthase